MGLLFGDKLKKQRSERGLSQEEFAALLGTSKQVISRYETSQRTPKITIAQDYADKLGIPLKFLIDDSITETNRVHDEESGSNSNDYYFDPQVSKIAQDIFENKELGILFNASKKLSKEDILAVTDIVKRMRRVDE